MLLSLYSGFIYFSITEGITPFLMLWSCYAFFSESRKQLFAASALLLLVRPQLMIFPLSMLVLSIVRKQRKIAFLLVWSFLPFIGWMLRNAYIAGGPVGIHPIYS